MPKASTLTASLVKHILVYGPPKSGKSQAVGKLAKDFNLHWFDCEFGSDVLFKPDMKPYLDNITLYRVPDSKKFPIAVQTLLKLFTAQKGSICWAHGNFNCVACKKDKPTEVDEVDFSKFGPKDIFVIDSWSQVIMSMVGQITKNKPDDYKMERDDWLHLKQVVENLATMIQGAPFHIVVISHEEVVEMVDKTDKIVPVGGSRNTSRNFAQYFGEVVYMQVQNKKHKALSSTTASNQILTGSRSDTVLEKGEEIDLLQLFKA